MTDLGREISASEGENPELPEWQVYRAYLEGPDFAQKPKMLDKMRSNRIAFGWFSFLLGPIYYLYRKQYVVGWLYFVGINVLALLVLGLGALVEQAIGMRSDSFVLWWLLLSLVVLMAANIAMGFAFYPLYRRSAKRAYEDWKIEGGEDTSAAIRYLERKGGISWTQVIVMIVLNLVISFATSGSLPIL